MWFPYDNAIGRGFEILDSEHNGVCVAKQIEEWYLRSERNFEISIGSVCTDDAGQYARAKRICR